MCLKYSYEVLSLLEDLIDRRNRCYSFMGFFSLNFRQYVSYSTTAWRNLFSVLYLMMAVLICGIPTVNAYCTRSVVFTKPLQLDWYFLLLMICFCLVPDWIKLSCATMFVQSSKEPFSFLFLSLHFSFDEEMAPKVISGSRILKIWMSVDEIYV